jgi:hypothetical protein
MNKGTEIITSFIEANTKVLVKRTPLTIEAPINIVYNPKRTEERLVKGENSKTDDEMGDED